MTAGGSQPSAVQDAPPKPRLLLVTDLELCALEATLERLRRLAGHPRRDRCMVGVRGPHRPARELVGVARAALDAGLRCVVHDRVDVALVVGAGVQLGERSVSPDEARALLPAGAWIGRSCHDLAGVLAAVEAGVDGITVSPVAPSPGKPPPIGFARFGALSHEAHARARARQRGVTVFALGGVDATNVGDAVAHRADGVAVVRAWLEAEDPSPVVTALLSSFVE